MVFVSRQQGGREPAGQDPGRAPPNQRGRERHVRGTASGYGEDGPERGVLGHHACGKAVQRGVCGGAIVRCGGGVGRAGEGQMLGVGWEGDPPVAGSCESRWFERCLSVPNKRTVMPPTSSES